MGNKAGRIAVGVCLIGLLAIVLWMAQGSFYPKAHLSVSADGASCTNGIFVYGDAEGTQHSRCLACDDPFVIESNRRACEEDGWRQYCDPPRGPYAPLPNNLLP
jgi:hypothetical protein